MTPQEHMASTALGRIQVSAELRVRATEQLVSAIRAARAAGVPVETIRVESGLPLRIVRKIVKGTGWREAMEDVAA